MEIRGKPLSFHDKYLFSACVSPWYLRGLGGRVASGVASALTATERTWAGEWRGTSDDAAIGDEPGARVSGERTGSDIRESALTNITQLLSLGKRSKIILHP